jgi:predicted DNA-binding transcriptional regulator
MKDVLAILKSLGLQPSEIETYVTALRTGATTVIDLAAQTGYTRQGVYLAIEALTKHGLMSSVTHGKRTLYAAEPPEKLVSYAKRRELDMREQIADLEKSLPALSMQVGGERPIVRMYEGKEGIKAYLAEIVEQKPKVMDELADMDAVFDMMKPTDLQPHHNALKRLKIFARGLYARSGPRPDHLPPERVELPKEYRGFKANLTVMGNTVCIMTLEGKLYTIVIEDKRVADAMRILFDGAHKYFSKKK